jgi:hypothetical protein
MVDEEVEAFAQRLLAHIVTTDPRRGRHGSDDARSAPTGAAKRSSPASGVGVIEPLEPENLLEQDLQITPVWRSNSYATSPADQVSTSGEVGEVGRRNYKDATQETNAVEGKGSELGSEGMVEREATKQEAGEELVDL